MIGVGVIGCGYWGPNLIRNFKNNPEVDLKAIADLNPDRLAAVGSLYPHARKLSDHKELIAATDIDAVVVATPVSTHCPLGQAVLEAGKHLFIEKPMAAKPDECRRLIELAESNEIPYRWPSYQ